MSKQANKALIGAFVVGAVVLTVGGILVFGSGQFFSQRETCVMYFEGDLKGLNVGAPVAFRGVRVGQVTDITVSVESDELRFNIPVQAEIDTQHFQREGSAFADMNDRDYLKALVEKGLRAQLALQSIVTGQLQIQLDIYPNAPLKLKGTEATLEIPTVPSSIERLTQALEEISFRDVVRNFNQAVTRFGDMLDNRELEMFFGRVQKVTDELAGLARHLEQEVRPMMQSVRQAADTVDRFFAETDREIAPVLSDAKDTLAAMQAAVSQAEQTLRSIDAVAAGYGERSAFRYEVTQTLNDIAAAANSLRSLTELLQQQPEALIRGKNTPGGS